MNDEHYMHIAIQLAIDSVQTGKGGPFGAIIVRNGLILGKGQNRVLIDKDPTAHAEVVAIRDACRQLDHFQLEGCTIYTSCEPCPMCLGAIYWARPERIVFGCTKEDASAIAFDDAFIYEELDKSLSDRQLPTSQILREECLKAFRLWQNKADRESY
ncbi:MAG TPA: nucleoside deaminase [Saprospiraceae bacterium]|nr:nucleoside deaminase [Saprospiraceae bacterium]HMQ85459.1 nucleoside deaminase [Saprospiraceae bacterium]